MAQVLRHLPPVTDPRILVDAATRDDAAVVRIAPDRAVVATVDVFTPIVDDPYDWGRIAAANALSDLYAMGARPLLALDVAGWPRSGLPLELLGEAVRGAAEVCRAAECLLLGGHSIDTAEPLFGLCAVGEAHPDRLMTVAQGRAGDLLVLTKPLGTGILSTALKRDLLGAAPLAAMVASMTTLNAGAMRAALAHEVRCATDVTGFGLAGHLGNIARASALGVEVWADRLPLLPEARRLAAEGVVPGGTRRNLAEVEGLGFDDDVAEVERLLVADAQTSGGLVLAVAPARVEGLVAALRGEGTPAAAVIGRLREGPAGSINVRRAAPEG